MIEPLLSDDAFLDDVGRARAQRNELHIWWIGQSGFLVVHEGRRLLLDPYLSDSLTHKYAGTDKPHVRMTRRVISPETIAPLVDVITSSHNHTDHLDAETIKPILSVNPNVELLVPAANRKFVSERLAIPVERFHRVDDGTADELRGFEIKGIAAAHDRLETNEEKYSKFLGYVVQSSPWTIYHSGDTVVYRGLMESLRPFNVDIALLPINGQVGNMNGADAARLAHDIGAKLVVPCHYEMFEFNTASPQELFVPECERLGQPYKVLRAGERLTLTK